MFCALREPPQLLSATQKAVIRFQVVGLLGREPLLVALRQVERERADNLLRHVVLHGEDVGQVAIETLRPQMSARGRVDKLCGDPYPVAGLADAALQHVAHAEVPAHLLNVHVPALEGEGRIASDHEQLRQL